MKNFLAKYGKHFWIATLFVTIPSLYSFFFKNGDWFTALLLSGWSYYFFLKGTGRLQDKDDPFVE